MIRLAASPAVEGSAAGPPSGDPAPFIFALSLLRRALSPFFLFFFLTSSACHDQQIVFFWTVGVRLRARAGALPDGHVQAVKGPSRFFLGVDSCQTVGVVIAPPRSPNLLIFFCYQRLPFASENRTVGEVFEMSLHRKCWLLSFNQ